MSEIVCRTAEESRAPADATAQRGDSAVIRALMVEDDAMFARVAAMTMLRAVGVHYEVTLASTLKEALRHLAATTPDVILLDLTLPDSTGMDTVQRVIGRANGAPVVILTGLDSEKMAIDAIQAGAQDYVVKGGDPQAILRAARYAVERSLAEKRLLEMQANLRKTQLQLIHAEKMESVGTLAAGIAHEVKNPLAVLQMGLEHIELVNAGNKDTTDTLRMMKNAIQRANAIIQRLLTYSTPSTSVRHPANLHDIIDRAINMVDHEIRRRHLHIRREFADILPELLLDANAIEQAFVNLLLNAAHASPDNRTITVTTRQAQLQTPGGGVGRRVTDRFPLGITVVECDIDDEGPGLDTETERRLFQPFFTTKPTGKGTGLGLCVTRNILDLHGGRIELMNRPEGGARARVMLVP